MKSNYFILLLLIVCSCTSIEDSLSPYTIEASIIMEDAWTNTSERASAPATTRAAVDPLFMVYLFNAQDNAISNKGGQMSTISNGVSFSNITTPGSYTLYGITNLIAGEYTGTGNGTTLTSTTTFALDATSAPRDIALGYQELTVIGGQNAYTISIATGHIMSQLELTIKSVPADVTFMTVTLPSQASVFDFTGTFTYAKDAQDNDAPVSQTIALEQKTAANQDGTHDWTCSPTIVFPCPTGTTSMPLTITWGPYTGPGALNGSKLVNTTSTHCCLSTKNLSLTTTWSESYRTSATITTSDWSALESGTFPW